MLTVLFFSVRRPRPPVEGENTATSGERTIVVLDEDQDHFARPSTSPLYYEHHPSPTSPLQHIPTGFRALFLLMSLGLCTYMALMLSDIASIVAVLGAIFANLFMLLIPALIYYLIVWPSHPSPFRECCLGLMLLCSFLGFCSLGALLTKGM